MELYKIIDRFAKITEMNAPVDEMTRFIRISFHHKKKYTISSVNIFRNSNRRQLCHYGIIRRLIADLIILHHSIPTKKEKKRKTPTHR